MYYCATIVLLLYSCTTTVLLYYYIVLLLFYCTTSSTLPSKQVRNFRGKKEPNTIPDSRLFGGVLNQKATLGVDLSLSLTLTVSVTGRACEGEYKKALFEPACAQRPQDAAGLTVSLSAFLLITLFIHYDCT